ncbi:MULTISPECIES: hypothetical protein [unclassified Thiocapsa]|uniref:Cas10/Cmr2 second palm domain-containing protein n=1 Tax=unclassified Thiocapsa TaxID=2641286 RepID=UPI0035B4A9B6
MVSYAYLFEAKSIQQYILGSGRLRHIVGASELIDSLTRDLLDDTLKELGLQVGVDVHLSRRAGGAVYLFSTSASARDGFRELWSLLVRQYAPNLEFIVACGQGETDYSAYLAATQNLQAARNRQSAWLPAGNPVTAFTPRTGNPAVESHQKLGLQDAATARFGADRFWRRGKLTDKFTDVISADDWPRDLEHKAGDEETSFPFLEDNRYLAIVHADGNGLGQVLRQLSEQTQPKPGQFVALFRDFSQAVAAATEGAAKQATEAVLLPLRARNNARMPARPIVLGGDDLTILLRADLALPFTRVFLLAFEEHSRTALRALGRDYPDITDMPAALTAGAGIAFVKSSHPFHLAHRLAESLAKHAKQTAKNHLGIDRRIPPTLAWHRVTTASQGEYRDILDQEMTFGVSAPRVRTTLEVYGIDETPIPGLPPFGELEKLLDLFGAEQMARGPARQILTLLGQDIDNAQRRYERWREVMVDRHSHELHAIDTALKALLPGGIAEDLRLPVSASGDLRSSPFGDIATLLAVTRGATHQVPVHEEDNA